MDHQIPIHVAKASNDNNNLRISRKQQHHSSHHSRSSTNNNNNNNNNNSSLRTRTYSDTDSSYVPETTSESGISDLDMSEKCNCCPYGFHIDVDFVNFLETLDSKNLVKQLKKIQRKRNERLQRSMEYVIDEVEKIKQINNDDVDDDFESATPPYEPPFPISLQHRQPSPAARSRRVPSQSPSRALITDTLKKTINEIDQEINRDFDAKLLIEQHKQRISSRSNSHQRPPTSARDERSPSVRYQSRSPSRSKRSVSRTSAQAPTQEHRSSFIQQYEHKSRSSHRNRSKSHSRSPRQVTKYKVYEQTTGDEADEEMMMLGNENQVETTTTYRQIIQQAQPTTYFDTSRLLDHPLEVPPSQEITLNVVSLASSDSSSSESLYSDEVKLKINEVDLPKTTREKIIIEKKVNNDELYKRINQLEKKLSKLPELEIKNSVLIEERNMLLKQLKERQEQEPKDYKSVGVSVVDKKQTRDVGVLHVQEIVDEKKEAKFVEMAAIINTLREKLDEQTISMQKPATRDVAVMHQVDKIEETRAMRDVAINHTTEDEQQKIEVHNMLAEQKEALTSTYIKELDILKRENVKLSSTLEEALKKRAVHVTTRGTMAQEGPQLYSVGVNTSKTTTRDVQVMFTPKSRDVAMSTDRFYYTRDVSLYCNLDNFEDYGDETFSTLSDIRQRGRKGPKDYRDVCIGVNCMPVEEPKVTRDVKIGVNLDHKEQRDVSIGCSIDVKPKVETRDVCIKVNLDEQNKKQLRDVCVGVHMQAEMKDASIFVNTIEPVKLPEKPQQKHVWLDTSSLHAYKDSCVGPDLQHLPLKRECATDTQTLVTKRDASTGAIHDTRPVSKQTSTYDFIQKRDASSSTANSGEVHRRDFTANANIEDQEKVDLIREITKLKMTVPKSTRDVAISMDHSSRLHSNLVTNSATSMETPKLVSKQQNTDTQFKREMFTNTDKPLVNVSHKGCGESNVNEVYISANEYNTLKTKLNQLEIEKTVKKDVRTQGVGLCTVYDNYEETTRKTPTVVTTSSVGVGNDEFIINSYKRSIACGDCKIDGNFCDKCAHRDIRSTGVGTVLVTRHEGCMTDLGNLNERIGFIRRNNTNESEIRSDEFIVEYPSTTTTTKTTATASAGDSQYAEKAYSTDIIHQKPSKINESRKETEYEQRKVTRIDGTKKLIKETIVMNANDKFGNLSERSSWETVIDNDPKSKSNTTSQASIVIPIDSRSESLGSTSTKSRIDDSNVTTISTEEVVYKDGEVLGKRIIGKLQLKPKGILKTNSVSNTNVANKALKFGTVISKRLQSASEESMGAAGGSIEDDSTLEASASYQVTPSSSSTLHEIVIPVRIQQSEASAECQEGEEGQLHEYDDNEMIHSIKEEDGDPSLRYKKTTSSSSSSGSSSTRAVSSRYVASSACKTASSASQRFELELELHIACCILNESLYEPLKADKGKVEKALQLIQHDWFKIAAQKESNPQLVMEHLNAFYSRFSNLLLERIVNMTDENFNTALHYSVSTGNFEIVNLLLDTKVCDVNAQNNAGYTSIMLAAVVPIQSEYDRQTLKRLFSEGNVNIKSTTNNQTALMLAVRHGNKEAVQLLLAANSDVNLQDKDGSTALMAACEHGYIDIVRLLLDNSNCDPDIKDNDGETAFDICKKAERNDIIVLLYAHSSKMRSHHPALQFSKSRPRIGSAPAQKKTK